MRAITTPVAGAGIQPSIAEQLPALIEVIVANGWAQRGALAQAQQALAGTATADKRASASLWLADHNLITREQAYDLESLLQYQAFLPGFQLRRKIGAGGMGTVFLALHIASGRLVALKTINARLAADGDFVGRFHREAKALGQIRHPNVAEIIDSGESEGHCWLAMEFIDGLSLMQLLKEHHALPEAWSLRVVRQVAEGLAQVYARTGLVHRDIKPENVLVVRSSDQLFGKDDVAKLIDFGLVKSTDENDERLTQTGMTIGTPLYMSPEQVRGEKLDCRSDIYGLGATLYHLFTGVTPFTGSSPGSIMSAHLTEPVPDPSARVPGLHAASKRLTMTAMAKKADARYLSWEAFVKACEDAIGQVDERGGTLRLLRKPMVIKNPLRKAETAPDPPPPAAPPPAAKPPTASTARGSSGPLPSPSAIRPPTTRQVQAPGGGKPATTATTRATAPASDQIGSDALRIQSSRVVKRSGDSRIPISARPASPALEPHQPAHASGSRSLDHEDLRKPASIGLLPWIVLGIAAIAAVVAFLLLYDG